MSAADRSHADSSDTVRRLTAILYADVAGYSRLVGDDEEGTHRVFRAHFDLLNATIERFGGRVVHTAGDAVLAEFASVVTALKCAVAAQHELAERNRELPEERKLQFRIGVNLGDVIIDREELYGTGVNVAARLESLAEPGGICISGRVFDQVEKNVEVGFADLGPQRVKNIEKPINVYKVLLDPGDAGQVVRAPAAARRPGRRWIAWASALGLVLALGFAGLWLWGPFDLGRLAEVPTAEDGAPTALAPEDGKPTIAILPFEDRGEDPAKAYFADGLTEDLIVDLGRFSSLLVLSWNAVAPYKDRNIPIDELSRDLNARYVVGGTVRRGGDRLRVTVQLTDAGRGLLLWSERYDRQLEDVFSVQGDITRHLVGALAVRLTLLEQERAFRKPTDDLDAYDLVLRGRHLQRKVERSANIEARGMFERAAAADPRYADALVGLGWTYMRDFLWGWSEWPNRALEQAKDLAERAISLDQRSAAASALLANVLNFSGEYERAEQEISRAINLNPNSAMSHAILGRLLIWSGRPEAAVSPLELAMRLDPEPIAWWYVNLAQAYYFQERYKDAVRILESIEGRFEEDPSPYAVLAAAYAQLGRLDAASRAVAGLKRISPFFDSRIYTRNLGKTEHGNHLLEGMRKAGLE